MAPSGAMSGRGMRSHGPQQFDRATWVRQLSRVEWIRASPRRKSARRRWSSLPVRIRRSW